MQRVDAEGDEEVLEVIAQRPDDAADVLASPQGTERRDYGVERESLELGQECREMVGVMDPPETVFRDSEVCDVPVRVFGHRSQESSYADCFCEDELALVQGLERFFMNLLVQQQHGKRLQMFGLRLSSGCPTVDVDAGLPLTS